MWLSICAFFWRDSPHFHQIPKSVHEAILLLPTTYSQIFSLQNTCNFILVSEALSSHFTDEDIEASGGMTCPRSQLISREARLKPNSDSQSITVWRTLTQALSYPHLLVDPLPRGESDQEPSCPPGLGPKDQVSSHFPTPQALAEVAHRPGSQRQGRLVGGWIPPTQRGQEHSGTRAPRVRGKLQSTGVELVPPYVSLQDQRGGKDRRSLGWSPQPTPGVCSSLIRSRSRDPTSRGSRGDTNGGLKALGAGQRV